MEELPQFNTSIFMDVSLFYLFFAAIAWLAVIAIIL